MIEEGVLDAGPTPVIAAYGFHAMASGTTVPPRNFGSRAGTLMAATDGYAITVTGRGGHGSMPHLAADPIVAAAQIVTTLQTMVTRTLGPFEPAVITVGSIHGGTAENIIPDRVVLGATLRTFDGDVRTKAIDGIRRVCEGIAEANGVSVSIEVDQGYPATVNDAAAVERASGIVAELLGADRWYDMPAPMPGGEDFSYVLERVPGAFLMLGAQPVGVPAEDAAFNHSAAARFDDSLVPDAAAVLAALALDHLA
jgi:amidohydrolase